MVSTRSQSGNLLAQKPHPRQKPTLTGGINKPPRSAFQSKSHNPLTAPIKGSSSTVSDQITNNSAFHSNKTASIKVPASKVYVDLRTGREFSPPFAPGVSKKTIEKKEQELRKARLAALAKSMPSAAQRDERLEFPRRAWGEREEIGLSIKGRAERDVEMWIEIVRANEGEGKKFSELKLEKARKILETLEDNEENLRVGAIDPGKVDIGIRIDTLKRALQTSQFEPEAENIRAAILGYKSGEIAYSDQYTLIYAGKIVDTAPDYPAFVIDRNERLDRYAKAHGSHWLWFEPPLKVHPESKPKLSASVTLERGQSHTNLGPYHVNQGFWKRHGWVHRMPEAIGRENAALEPFFAKNSADNTVSCQEEGPKLTFRSLLDSGATYPSLFTSDLDLLGINKTMYAAQSIERVGTANGVVESRLWEMYVCVLDMNGNQLVKPDDAVWPYHGKYLGGLCPCLESVNPMLYDATGKEATDRLSGLIPFLACYVTSCPTRDRFFLGEDRNDVLGFPRMPGQKRWDIRTPREVPNPLLDIDKFDNPTVTFTHRGGQMIDEDSLTEPHASRLTIFPGPNEIVFRYHPKAECENMIAQAAQQVGLSVIDPQAAWDHLQSINEQNYQAQHLREQEQQHPSNSYIDPRLSF